MRVHMGICVPGAGNVAALNTLGFVEAAESLRWSAERCRASGCGGDGGLAGFGAVIAHDWRSGCHLSVSAAVRVDCCNFTVNFVWVAEGEGAI